VTLVKHGQEAELTSTTLPSTTTGSMPDTGQKANDSGTAMEQVQQKTQQVGSQLTSRVKEQADQRSTEVGEHVSSIAAALRSTSENLRTKGEGAPANALETVTDQVERVGSYLTRVDGDQLLHDLDDMARQRPWAIAATMFGLGVAAARVMSASSRQRYEARGGQVQRPATTYRATQYGDSGTGNGNGNGFHDLTQAEGRSGGDVSL
jgi:hypothetical protein